MYSTSFLYSEKPLHCTVEKGKEKVKIQQETHREKHTKIKLKGKNIDKIQNCLQFLNFTSSREEGWKHLFL